MALLSTYEHMNMCKPCVDSMNRLTLLNHVTCFPGSCFEGISDLAISIVKPHRHSLLYACSSLKQVDIRAAWTKGRHVFVGELVREVSTAGWRGNICQFKAI